jgi:hypothetical protein
VPAHLTTTCIVVALCAAASASSPAPADASPRQAHVVCFHRTNSWHEAVRPNKCNLRKKGAQGFYYILRKLHWSHWGRSSANGSGRWRISDAKLRIHIRLWRPKTGWGPVGIDKRYFSRAKISGPHVQTDRFRIDVPHSRHL